MMRRFDSRGLAFVVSGVLGLLLLAHLWPAPHVAAFVGAPCPSVVAK